MATKSKLTRQNSWRDSHAPFTKAELEYFKDVIVPTLPSFDGKSISSSDFQVFCDKLKWPRSPELMKAYERCCDKYIDGRLELERCISLLENFHNPAEWFAVILDLADTDNDGFIDQNEYELLIEMLTLHAKDWCGKTYTDFVKDVDANEDGKVSIEECKDWVEKHAPNYED